MQTLNENWGACDLVLIVHELHQRGYEQLRLFGGMSPNGMAWRWNIYPKCLMDKPEYEWYDDCPPFECPHGSADCPKCVPMCKHLGWGSASPFFLPQRTLAMTNLAKLTKMTKSMQKMYVNPIFLAKRLHKCNFCGTFALAKVFLYAESY